MAFSIIVPIYNEEKSIKQTLNGLLNFLQPKYQKNEYEIILINDGSTDNTKQVLENFQSENVKLINHSNNRGYGAALKNGVNKSKYDVVVFFDGDGQHKPEYIPALLKPLGEYDIVVGARSGYQGPTGRQPGKKILKYIAEYLINKKIPDINSGLRAIKKDAFLSFVHLFPNGFSLSTTSTLAFFSEGLNIKYIPITINQRVGKSTVKIKDGLNAIMLILRMIMLFNPMKIFGPISLLLLIGGGAFSVYGILAFGRFPISGVVVIISGLILFFNGLLADQLATIKRGRPSP